MAPTRPNYELDEKCLCFHGALLYEAKILNMKQIDPNDRKSPWQYEVHYKGWKKTWDDLVPEERLRKLNAENKEMAETLMNATKRQQLEERRAKEAKRHSTSHQSKRKSAAAGSEFGSIRGSEERNSAPGRGTKRGRDWELEKEENFVTRPSVRMRIPDYIKGRLVDDWENITKDLLVVPLPRPHPVSELLETYRQQELPKRRPGSADYDICEEVIKGLREYFDISLGRVLLYRYERQQWLEIHERMNMRGTTINPVGHDGEGEPVIAGKTPADVYGAEHLCRLIVTLPELVAQTNMDVQSVFRMRDEVMKLVNWLVKNSNTYFCDVYEDPGQSYGEKARGTAARVPI